MRYALWWISHYVHFYVSIILNKKEFSKFYILLTQDSVLIFYIEEKEVTLISNLGPYRIIAKYRIPYI